MINNLKRKGKERNSSSFRISMTIEKSRIFAKSSKDILGASSAFFCLRGRGNCHQPMFSDCCVG